MIHGNAGDDLIMAGLGDDVIFGEDGNDIIEGGVGDDDIFAGEGDDQVGGGLGADRIHGGTGDDSVSGGQGSDIIEGGDGIDVIYGNEGLDTIYGGLGNDQIHAGLENDYVEGNEGDDLIDGGAGNDELLGDEGDDTITGGIGSDRISGGDDDDILIAGPVEDPTSVSSGYAGEANSLHFIFGGAGDDLIYGDLGDDEIYAGEGDNEIRAYAGNDLVQAGDGNNFVDTADGIDTIELGDGDNTIIGGAGSESVTAGDGVNFIDLRSPGVDEVASQHVVVVGSGGNVIFTDAGFDRVTSGSGDDQITLFAGGSLVFAGDGDNTVTSRDGVDEVTTGAGADFISTGGGDDLVDSGEGDDDVRLGDGNDVAFVGAGHDMVSGGGGDDSIYLNDGNDLAQGGDGNDLIVGGRGDDSLDGGAGIDILWGGSEAFAREKFDANVPANFVMPPDYLVFETLNPTGYTPPRITPAVLAGVSLDGEFDDGVDHLRGGADGDFIFGGGMVDDIRGGAGNDFIDGGVGAELIFGDAGDDIIFGGGGADNLLGGPGIDQLYGGIGDDLIRGGSGTAAGDLTGQRGYGGPGHDSLYAWAASTDSAAQSVLRGEELHGGGGNDFLHGNLRREVMSGGTGNDYLHGESVAGPNYGRNSLADVTGGDDVMYGDGGEDQLFGGGGNDTIFGGGDSDFIEGQDGNDLLRGGGGIDFFKIDVAGFYSSFDDSVDGHFGNRTEGDVPDDNATDIALVEGTNQDDVITIGESVPGTLDIDYQPQPVVGSPQPPINLVWRDVEGNPLVEQFRIGGLGGDDVLGFAGGANAIDVSDLVDRSRDWVGVINGGPGDDRLTGTNARDRIDGGSGSDVLFGFGGDDRLYGDNQNGSSADLDVLFAGAGNDDLIGGVGTNRLYAWSIDPDVAPGTEPFGVFVDPVTGQLTTAGGPGFAHEDTGLNRMLGGPGDDQLYGGTGLDFMYGGGGDNQLFTRDGELFEDGLDVPDDAWKAYARSTDRVWYYGGTGADDTINVDYVTEPGLLGDHHLITRLTETEAGFTFDAQVRLDFEATDEDGNRIWDPVDIVASVDRIETLDPSERGLAYDELQLTGNLLPPEGDFLAIIIDSLGGNDTINVGPTVQKTVWIDAGEGDDRVTIQAGNAILVDTTEGQDRNEILGDSSDPSRAFPLFGPYELVGSTAAAVDGTFASTDGSAAIARISLQFADDAGPTVLQVNAEATTDNTTVADLAADLNDAILASPLAMRVTASARGGRIVLTPSDFTESAALAVTGANTLGRPVFGFAADDASSAQTIAATTTFQNLTIDNPADVDWYGFRLSADAGATSELRVVGRSSTDLLDFGLFELMDDGTTVAVGGLSDAVAGTDYVVQVRSANRVPTVYDITLDLGDGADPATVDFGSNPDLLRRDVIIGGPGNDALQGGPSEDWIFGGPGNDILSGGYDRQASDLVFGGPGDDLFQILVDALPVNGAGQTILTTQSDRLDGGVGHDEVIFIGGDLDDLSRPVPDHVAIRFSRFLQRYE